MLFLEAVHNVKHIHVRFSQVHVVHVSDVLRLGWGLTLGEEHNSVDYSCVATGVRQ